MPPATAPCPVASYAHAVLSGEIVAGRLVRLACARHLRDLETGHERGLEWDQAAAEHAIGFFSHLRLPEGDAPFVLRPPLAFIVGSICGWKGEDGYRRFRTAYNEMGKGNAKTPTAAGIGLYGLVADGERSAEIYTAGVTRDQATYLLDDARKLVDASPALRRRIEVGAHNLAVLSTHSYMRPVSSEARTLDQKRVHMALIDEIHEHPHSMVVDKMRAGTKGRKQALIFEITNSGYDRNSVCWHHHEYSIKVLEGILEDDSWFAYVCQLDPCDQCRAEGYVQPRDGCSRCDDWRDESCWPKANPMLDFSISRKYLREQVREAIGMPAKESLVKRLNFCYWTESAVHAIPMDKWDICSREPESLYQHECYGGLDIGSTSDFTAFTLLFPHNDVEMIEMPVNQEDPEGEKRKVYRRSYTLKCWFWLPEAPAKRDQRMQQIIDGWKRQGLISTCWGETVDYDQVLEDILKLEKQYDLRAVAFDRGFQGGQMGMNLLKHFGEHRIFTFSQGIISMNAPFREFIELVKLGRMYHDGNPVLRWMAANTAAETRGGLIKPSKDHSAEKIDGITAATMALGLAMAQPAQPVGRYYETNPLETI